MLVLCKMVKTRGCERLQGQLGYNQPGQEKLCLPHYPRKILSRFIILQIEITRYLFVQKSCKLL